MSDPLSDVCNLLYHVQCLLLISFLISILFFLCLFFSLDDSSIRCMKCDRLGHALCGVDLEEEKEQSDRY